MANKGCSAVTLFYPTNVTVILEDTGLYLTLYE